MSVTGSRSLLGVQDNCQQINKERLWQWILSPEMFNVTQNYYVYDMSKAGWIVKLNPCNMLSV